MEQTNNSSTTTTQTDGALLVPDVLSVPTPLRAESLRQLEEVGPCQTAGAAEANPATTAVTVAVAAPQGDAASRASTPASDLSPPNTTDESDAEGDEDEESDDEASLAGSSTGSVAPDAEAASRRAAPLAPLTAEGKKVLVTGGAGFVGSHVADHLLSRGDAVIVVDEFNDYYDTSLKRANIAYLLEKHGPARLRIVEADICDAHAMEQLFITERPRHVVHMAARAGVRPSIDDPFVYIHSNMLGTTRLLELARIHGNDCFVWASSSSVYGGSPNEEFSEDDYVDNPVSPYAATKKACELMTYTYHSLYKMNVSGLRFFTVYGPRGRPDMAPFKFVDRVSRGLEIQQFGDGTSSRDYTYIDDIVDGVVRALDRPLGYQIFNLGNGSPYRLCDFISLVEKEVGKKAVIKVLPDQPGDVPRTCANISKAQELLGYAPRVSFEEGIKRTVAWYNEWQAAKAKTAVAEGQPAAPNAAGSASGASSASASSSSDPASSLGSDGQPLASGAGGGGKAKVRPAGSRVRRVASQVSVFSTGGMSG